MLRLFLSWLSGRDAAGDVKSLVCLLVTVPQRADAGSDKFAQLIAPIEQFYASLSTTIHQRTWIDWLLATPAHISLEIVAIDGVISFQIIAPKRIKTIVERQLHSFFADAEITYGRPVSLMTNRPQVAGVTFEQAKNFILPIRTYNYMEADPLTSLTTAMTKLPQGSAAAVQLLIRPIGDAWRVHTNIATTQARENKLHLVNQKPLMRLAREIIAPPKAAPTDYRQATPIQEDVLKALQEKGSKTGFESILRVVTTGETEAAADGNLKALLAAFAQYHSPNRNSLRYQRRAASQVARDYVLRSFVNAKKMILTTEELASLWHLPTALTDTPGVKWLMSRTLPAPTNLPEQGTVIGESNYRGVKKLVRLSDEDRRRHLFMIGKTGVGKTTLFQTMIEQDMHNGKGLCFIDPLGDAIEYLLPRIPTNRADDVILLDPSDADFPIGLNLLEWQKPEEKDFLIQEVIEIFYKLFDPNRTGIVGPQWEHWARNAALTVMSQPGGGTIIDIPRLFMDDNFRTEAISHVRDSMVKSFWEQQLAKTADFHKSEMYNYFISKFGRFMTNDIMRNIIGQKQSSFDFREAMDSGKIILINLAKGKIGEINSNLLGLILVTKLQLAAFRRADQPEDQRRDFYLYVDEFQNFTTDSFATILAEARKYRLNLNVTNQYFAQLTEQIKDAVIGNVGTLVSYRIGAEDADFLAKELPGVTAEDLTNLDRFQCYVKLLIDLAPSKAFSMNGLKLPDQGDAAMTNWIRQASRHKYAKSKIT